MMPENPEDKPKTAKQLEKEAKKLAKLEKLKTKQSKIPATSTNVSEKKDKKKSQEVKKEEIEVKIDDDGKKNVSGPIPDSYNPKYVEAAWYAWWEKEGFFKPEYGRTSILDENPKGKFVMVIPPPNVTGTLHVGHALTNAIEDTVTRWNRMKGRTTLWNPGCDHAGIATQVVVEKKCWKELGKTRHDIGREEFIKKIWEWKNEKGDRIYTQLRRLGSSLDWSRACFTMDEKLSIAVKEAFVKLHEDGDIYRSNRLVNWSCALKSAISDIEVDKLELTGRTFLNIPGYKDKIEFGVLVHFVYEIDESTNITVATTRIETMLGDTAIAVHPDDERYKHLIGKHARHPFSGRLIPIIKDDYVDKDFGTGAVKITPAHDPNDYEIGKRHNLPFITIFSDDGLIIGDCKEFVGLKRFEARKAVLGALKEKGLYRETTVNPMVVPVCSRSKDVVEPMIKPQWYVKCDVMAKNAIEAVESGKLKIVPEHHVKIWNHWMTNIRDWCISRQLWWGHKIPAYHVSIPGIDYKDDDEYWVSGRSVEEAMDKAVKRFNVDKDKIKLEQDPDVLDTWFSSGLFPFSIFGWPNETDELKAFFPGTLLETGHDILFFWVARMVFFSQRLLNKLPFREVLLHAIVRDAHGRKMSKSLGNVIDPMDVVNGITLEQLHKQLEDSNLDQTEIKKAIAAQKQDYPNGIPECGTDALRFALCAYMSQGRDINLDILRVQGYRFFCNKLWNAVKFVLRYFPKETYVESNKNDVLKRVVDKYVTNETQEKDELSIINDYLANNAYLDGYEISKLDLHLWKSIRTNSKTKGYQHIERWKRNVEFNYNMEYPMDAWILSKLYNAVKIANAAFENYELSNATTACYNLWLYELCDVYLESLKPILSSDDNEKKMNVGETLLYVIDTGLRLLSPFMPFITEELYQRLPMRSDYVPSICIAPYPEPEDYQKWENRLVEEEVEFVQKIIHSIRSAQSDYDIPRSTKIEVYAICTDGNTNDVVSKYKSQIEALANISQVQLSQTAPKGCAILTITHKCQLHLLLKDFINVPKELEKMKKKEENLEESINKLIKAMNIENYKNKVPLKIQNTNEEKLNEFKEQLSKVKEASDVLKNM